MSLANTWNNQPAVSYQRVRIVTVDPTTNRIEGVQRDGALLQITMMDSPLAFRWPVEGETWTVKRMAQYWTLDQLVDDPKDNLPLEELQPGEAKLAAERVFDREGRRFVAADPTVVNDGDALVWTEIEGAWVPSSTTTVQLGGARITGTDDPGDRLLYIRDNPDVPRSASTQLVEVQDYNGAPIFSIPPAGGPKAYGDKMGCWAGVFTMASEFVPWGGIRFGASNQTIYSGSGAPLPAFITDWMDFYAPFYDTRAQVGDLYFEEGGTTWQCTTAGTNTSGLRGGTWKPYTPTLRVTKTVTVSTGILSGSVVSFDAESYDTWGMHSSVTNPDRLFGTKTGVWRVSAQAKFASNATNYRVVQLQRRTASLRSHSESRTRMR